MLARPRWPLVLAMVLAATAPLPAQEGDGKLTLTAAFEPAAAPPGAEVTLVLSATVEVGWHAYGSREQTQIPVGLDKKKLQAGGLEVVGAAVVPPGTKKTTFGIDTYPLPNAFTVKQRMKVPAGMAAGAVTVRGVLDYQVCDENQCLMPSAIGFEATLQVTAPAGGAAKEKPAKQDLPLPDPDAKLTIKASVQPSPARAGEDVTLVLDVTVEPPYHAYGTKETTNIPVAVEPKKLQLGGLESKGNAVVPAGEKTTLFGVESYPLPESFRITQPLRVPEGTQPGTVEIGGVLDYQLCDENSCDVPADAPFTAKLVIEAGAAREDVPGADVESAAPAGDLLTGSLLALLLACIGGGLFALVMPCTYPMIPITFSFFTKQADARGGKVMTLALTYGAGIVVMFALIGALAGVVGGVIVPFAAHWITNFVIGAFFVVFGLSLLGLITLQPPAFLVNAAGRSGSAGGLVGVLLMGATLVITSFTCTAPIVALLLVPAVQSGDHWRPTLGMAVFGLTMALPFVFLSLLPGRVRSLPRSGEWMNTLKVSLGFIELAAALKFFSNAEYVEELYILPRELFFGIWIAIFVALAVYLWGLVPRRTVGIGRRIGGLASVAFAAYCLHGALGYKQDFVMTALAPAYGLRDVSRHEIVVDDYEKAAARASSQGMLVLVNFTGFTCTNCRMVERGILPADAIAPILEEHFVEARLHMDNPSVIPPDKWARHVQLRLDLVEGRVTTPSYVTVDPETGSKLVEHVLTGGPGAWEAGYLAFLERSLAKAGREVAANR